MSGNSVGMVVTAFVAGSTPRGEEAPGSHGHGSRGEKEWTVRDVMSSPVVYIPPNAPVKAVAELLRALWEVDIRPVEASFGASTAPATGPTATRSIPGTTWKRA